MFPLLKLIPELRENSTAWLLAISGTYLRIIYKIYSAKLIKGVLQGFRRQSHARGRWPGKTILCKEVYAAGGI